MKANLKTTFDRYGKYVTGHIEDAEMYQKIKAGTADWKDSVKSRITHIRVPKEVFEMLLELDRNKDQCNPCKKIFIYRSSKIKGGEGG